MDAFNFLSVMVSVVVGLGLTQLLAGIGNFVQVRRRVDFYWLHTAWMVLLIFLHLQVWWSFWATRVVADWNYAMFVYVLVGPGALVVASHILVPELLEGRIDVRRHYFDTAPVFFGILTVAAVWAIFIEPITGVRRLLIPLRIVQVLGAGIFIACALSRNRRLHEAAFFLVSVLLLFAVVLTRFRLGQIDLRV